MTFNRSLLFFLGILCALSAHAQPKMHQYTLWLKDKPGSPYSLSRPLEFLSPRSMARRERQHFALVEGDLPVSPNYLQQLKKDSLKILFTSRWLNTVTVETADSTFPDKLWKYPFAINLQRVKLTGITHSEETDNGSSDPLPYGASFVQVNMPHGDFLHNLGFRGEGMQIAVIDAGFRKVDSLFAFQALRKRNGILTTHDFADRNDSVYEDDAHGMEVLSVMAGRLDNKLIGTAAEADYYLLRSEVAKTEYPSEEFGWIAALEWADSAGADVVNSSLGYTQFTDSTLDHTIFQLDGESIPISRVAGMAASKGMILVNSAGNSGIMPWKYLSIPADAKNILAVGAVDDKGNPALFSSHGPSADGRVKPDVSALGFHTVIASLQDSQSMTGNGTSFAAPVITGLVTCLWQEFRDKTSYEIMDAVRKSANHYLTPGDQIGYGIPDFSLAREILLQNSSESHIITVYPNPFKNSLKARFFSAKEEDVTISLTDALGRSVWQERQQVPGNFFYEAEIIPSTTLPVGVYVLTVTSSTSRLAAKVIRY